MELKSFCLVLVLSFTSSMLCRAGELPHNEHEAQNELASEKRATPLGPQNATTLSTHWTSFSGGPFKHLSIGRAGVWALDNNNNVYRMPNTYLSEKALDGTYWQRIAGSQTITQLDVGYNVVLAITNINEIFYRDGITNSYQEGTGWTQVPGHLAQISVSQEGHIWGTGNDQTVWHRLGADKLNKGGTNWKEIPGTLKQVSIGNAGLWGSSEADRVWYRKGTYGDPCSDPDGTGWAEVTGQPLNYISSADTVYGTNDIYNIFYRQGVSTANPTGSQWVSVAGSMKMIESLSLTVWGLDGQGYPHAKESD